MKVYSRDNYLHNSYMCRTNRHNWIIDREATEETNGLKHCKWCGIKQDTVLYTLLKCAKSQHNASEINSILDIMGKESKLLKDVPFVEAGSAA